MRSFQPLYAAFNANEVKVLVMTLEGLWNPHHERWKINEEKMIDSEGQIIESGSHVTIL